MYKCKKCTNSNYRKAGFVKGEQRYQCRLCGCKFVPTRQKGMTTRQKTMALFLYTHGLSFRAIARAIRIQHSAVYRFIRNWAEANYEKPEPCEDAVVVLELDEMWHYIKDKKTDSGFGRLIVAILHNSSTGSAEGEILLHSSSFLTE